MEHIGILETIIAITVGVSFIFLFVFAIAKLIKSKIPINQKILWGFGILFFHFLGAIAFLIYHDVYLPPIQRATY